MASVFAAKERLAKARQQYENLLIHSDATLMSTKHDDMPSPTRSSIKDVIAVNNAISPSRYVNEDPYYDDLFNSSMNLSKSLSQSSSFRTSNYQQPQQQQPLSSSSGGGKYFQDQKYREISPTYSSSAQQYQSKQYIPQEPVVPTTSYQPPQRHLHPHNPPFQYPQPLQHHVPPLPQAPPLHSSLNRMLHPQEILDLPETTTTATTRGFEEDTLFDQQNNVINSLRDENDKLKTHLRHTVDEAHEITSHTLSTKEDIIKGYELRLQQLMKRTKELETENKELKKRMDISNKDLMSERENLQKALRIIDRFKKRSKQYLEVQKKAHKILTNPHGNHCVTIQDREITTSSKTKLPF